ncbi:MAG: hypothetical protein OK404_00270 [Thaumarchaeota archaeon]|nr:hypothetical protein [Nitrososphaerota archaeon]
MVLPSRGLSTYPELASKTLLSKPGRLSVMETYARALAKTDYDVIVAGSRLAWVMGAAARRGRGAKLVAMLLGSDIRRLQSLPMTKRILMERSLKSSDYAFYTSPDTMELTSRLGVPFSRLPFPVDTKIFTPDGPAEDLSGDPAVFVPTRLDADKGTGTIAKVIRHILREHKDARLHMVKWAKAQATLDRVVGEIGSDRITLVDFLKRRAMPRYYRGASVLIGQMQLGFGSMTEWESIGCGLPPVFYDIYDGYGVKERDPGVLSACFDRLVTDEKFRRTRVQEGLDLVRSYHEVGTVYQLFRERVKQLLEHR